MMLAIQNDIGDEGAMSGNVPRIVVADDHPLMRVALKEALGAVFLDAHVHEAATIAELVLVLESDPEVDAVLLDLRMPDSQGFSALVKLRAQFPSVPVIIVSAVEDFESIDRAITLGASGYILKSAPIDSVREAVVDVLAGKVIRPAGRSNVEEVRAEETARFRRVRALTPQQLNVLVMMAEGHSNKTIGGLMNITESTVKSHITSVLLKLGLQRRTQAAIFAQRVLQLRNPVSIADSLEDPSSE